MTLARMFQRRDTAANWTSANPVLGDGEWGKETDTGRVKMGDGATAWNSLAYSPSAADLALKADQSDLTALQTSLAPVATAGTYASLTGKPTLGTAAAQNVEAFATAADLQSLKGPVRSTVDGTVIPGYHYVVLADPGDPTVIQDIVIEAD